MLYLLYIVNVEVEPVKRQDPKINVRCVVQIVVFESAT